MLIALLPVLTLATTETITFDSQEELEDAASVRLRSAIASGWTLVDASAEDDGSGLGFTLTQNGAIERLVIAFDRNVYRVGPADLPASPTRPSARLLEALRGRGGIRIVGGCDGLYEEPYLIDDTAAGPEARSLVARSLAAADDLEGAWVSGRRAIFQLEADGKAVDLVVTLGEEGGVAGAELRRYASRGDFRTYRRRGALARALRGASVTRIESTGSAVVLRTSRGRFTIDPDGAAFREKPRDVEYEGGCGC
ncbi:MAG TPA: hypothetical protein VNO30_39825 [Kofleriaceae bacterium]|nr:hypothetical protein [Kofleriaceae bacterium]